MKNRNRLFWLCIGILALAVILISDYCLVKMYLGYRKSNLLYKNAQTAFTKVVEKKDIAVNSPELHENGSDNSASSTSLQTGDRNDAAASVNSKNEGQETTAENLKIGEQDTEDAAETGKDVDSDMAASEGSGSDIEVDFFELQKINGEIVGWIYFENEDISYPVLYSGDNEKYLSTAYTGEPMNCGSIFVDGANNPDFSDRYTIVYGHNMKNTSMFGKLKYYRQREDYYEEHKYFRIITPEAVYRYQIFGCREVSPDSEVYTVSFSDTHEFLNFVNSALAINPQAGSGIDLQEESKIITLSTCSGNAERFVVSAVCIEKWENYNISP